MALTREARCSGTQSLPDRHCGCDQRLTVGSRCPSKSGHRLPWRIGRTAVAVSDSLPGWMSPKR